ncbi:flagellar basal body-associated FliL family protein [Telmatospirillum sp. J64-1]|uniref:flagellar basal body-associated FliL family protein n=1 Tax=Telmatospirillum sp. J64-1 TaxID=2502183 RepID=UPI00115E751B|nr:flagellar basal body-associated FliL family protein [Telmatospirillum sp. J64-1]
MAEDLEEDFEEGEGADPSAIPGSKRNNGKLKKLLLLLVLPLVLVLGGAAAVYYSGIADVLFAPSTPKVAAAPAPGSGPVQPAVFYDLPEMLVNLNTGARKQSFLKIRVSLELENSQDIPRIEQVMPRIIDNFQVYLRELRLEDLQGAAGVYRLREELLTRVNMAARPARVNDVLFKEMLVQ